MDFEKKWMRRSALIRQGLPAELLDRVWNTPRQRVAVKVNPMKSNSPIIFDTDALKRLLERETDIDQLKRGIT